MLLFFIPFVIIIDHGIMLPLSMPRNRSTNADRCIGPFCIENIYYRPESEILQLVLLVDLSPPWNPT